MGATFFPRGPNRASGQRKELCPLSSHGPPSLLNRSGLPGPNSWVQSLSKALITGQAVGFPLPARWMKTHLSQHSSASNQRMALLPVHSQNYSQLRKRSFKRACRAATVKQQPVYYRGQVLTPTQVRRSGNCPPPIQQVPRRSPGPRAGLANREIRVLSWNAGHLGQQQWAEVKSWLHTEAREMCDVLVLQETHWKETAEFSAAGWYVYHQPPQQMRVKR